MYINNKICKILSSSTLTKNNSQYLFLLLTTSTQTLWQRVSSSPSPSPLPSPSSTSSILHSWLASKMLLLLMLLLDVPSLSNCIGYSYSRFVGPVTGPEEKVFVRDAQTGIGNVDYVAHPKYQFSYGVEDSGQRILQNRKETRDGDNVHGIYSLMDPDGSLRVVKYTADNVNGFQAEVITNGVPILYGHTDLQNDPDDEKFKGNGYWETELPNNAAGTQSEDENVSYSNEEIDDTDTNNNDNEDNDDNEDEYDDEENTETQDDSSEEEFEDAETD